MYCPNCGEELLEDANHCINCGTEIGEDGASQKIDAGVKDSVAHKSPGAGSVYAPKVDVSEEKEKCPEK